MKLDTLALRIAILLLVVPMGLASCATIVGSATHNIPIFSKPAGANVKVVDEKGEEVFNGTTPANVTLKKSDGDYFGKKTYTITISKAGFQPQVIPVKASISMWYLVGNFFSFSIIGWLIVDPLTGKMYNLSPDSVDANMAAVDSKAPKDEKKPKSSHNNTSTDGSITVMLLEDVPAELRSEMVALN